MEEARLRNGAFDGTVGKVTNQCPSAEGQQQSSNEFHEASQEGASISLKLVVWLDRLLFSRLTYSAISKGNNPSLEWEMRLLKTEKDEKLVFTDCYQAIETLSNSVADLVQSTKIYRIALFVAFFLYGAATVGGMVVVGQMLKDYGSCIRMY
ncbi:uncharacterized protein LTHEOB_4016 [Lasiodiplodia theobromae]|uniref:uncharacterized protein n=1 Tax=Lasiodiplodia theobromae TaxID=45133 RepID=UPI0015C35663|nr:uncharacterized protein LTHEOB_4016 [Lasiodiplodia theobromae]KAF4546708.1 hypothetical protein LTHEOB_4016 [Lasiodiplodia theobromae]